MRELGAQVLRIREFLGLSQEQLARLARVSQGAISRLENGRGLATPLLVVLKTCGALRAALMQVDQEILSPEARKLVVVGAHIPGEADSYPGFPPTHDQWLAIAEHEVRDSEARGRKVSRVIIDPDQFIEYCRKKHLKFDDEARAEFVLERMGIMAELKR